MHLQEQRRSVEVWHLQILISKDLYPFLFYHFFLNKKGLNSSGTNVNPIKPKLAPRFLVLPKSEVVL